MSGEAAAYKSFGAKLSFKPADIVYYKYLRTLQELTGSKLFVDMPTALPTI